MVYKSAANLCAITAITFLLSGCTAVPLTKINPLAFAPAAASCQVERANLMSEPKNYLYVAPDADNRTMFVQSKGTHKTYFEAYSAQANGVITADLPAPLANHSVAKKMGTFLIAASAQAQLNAAKANPARHNLVYDAAEEQRAITASVEHSKISHGEMKDFAEKLFSSHLRANPGAFARTSRFSLARDVNPTAGDNSHDGMFYSYFGAYYNGKFVDRMGVKVDAPKISQTITDAEITAAETILLEYLFDKIDKTPVLGHTDDKGTITFYPGASTTAPTVYTVLHESHPEIYLEISDGKTKTCGFTAKNAWILKEIASGAGDQAAAVGGLVANTAGGVSIGLGVLGKISIGDNQTLSVLAKTFASRLATRAALDAAFWALQDAEINISEPGA